MKKSLLVNFRIEPEKWQAFEYASRKYGRTPTDIVRELIYHVDACMVAIASGELVNMDGDVANFLMSRFNFNAEQWRTIAYFLAETADIAQSRTPVGGKL